MSEDTALIGIDWGTSRLRAYRVSVNGGMLERRTSDRGISAIRDGRFDEALGSILKDWPPGCPILMCGMVGSRQGWREIPYQDCPARAADLATALRAVQTGYGPAWIIGGVRSLEVRQGAATQALGKVYDVMRGEETQIVGVACDGADARIVTPGTHSKWAVVRGACIEGFRTYMTGELYALLEKHSILGWLMGSEADHHDHETSFLDGVRWGLQEPLLHSLFSVRTQGLFAQRAPGRLASYMSGILIGSEVSAEVGRDPWQGAVTVIAGAEFGRLYQAALSAAGCSDVRLVDADVAVVQGLWKIWGLRGRTA